MKDRTYIVCVSPQWPLLEIRVRFGSKIYTSTSYITSHYIVVDLSKLSEISFPPDFENDSLLRNPGGLRRTKCQPILAEESIHTQRNSNLAIRLYNRDYTYIYTWFSFFPGGDHFAWVLNYRF